jgi:DNA-directed RNA polymerase specialized sigma24 family protein
MSCFCEIGPGLLLFARQWARSAADAEDIVQEAFVKFWRRNRLQRLDDMMGIVGCGFGTYTRQYE